MNNDRSRTLFTCRLVRNASLSVGIVVACGLVAGNVTAQAIGGVTVNNPSSWQQAAAKYLKEYAQYKAVLEHYQQQLVMLTHMDFTVPEMQNNYEEISDSDAQKQALAACPSPDGAMNSISGLLQIFTPSANSKILSNQLTICRQIQLRQVDKYNLTVKMMKRLKDYAKNVPSLQQQAADGGTSEGANSGTKTNIELNAIALESEMQAWRSQIMADDQMISYMQNQQAVQARQILRGSTSLAGRVIQAATFAAAFH